MSPATDDVRAVSRLWPYALAVLFFLFIALLALKPIADPDIWFHLSTGRWIMEHRALPDSDPFTYTSAGKLSAGQIMGLRSQWLGQVAFYQAYLADGFRGLAVMRVALMLLPFVLAYAAMCRSGAAPWSALAIMLAPGLLSSITLYNTFERPQAFSFIMSLLVVLILMQGRKAALWAPLIALMMFVWTQLHGGFNVGMVIIVLYMCGAATTWVLDRGQKERALAALIIGGAGLAATMTGQGRLGWQTIKYMALDFIGLGATSADPAQAGSVVGSVLEYKPLWYFITHHNLYWPVFIIGFYALCILSLALKYLRQGRVDVPEALVAAFAVIFGVYYARGVGFALVILAYVAGMSLKDMGQYDRRKLAGFFATLAVGLMLYGASVVPGEIRPAVPARWINPSYPEYVLRFVKDFGIKGRVFNHISWGGYLEWRLYPEGQVFMDGREVDQKAFNDYLKIIGGAPGWQELMDQYEVDYMMLPLVEELDGKVPPVVFKALEEAPDKWKPVFRWGNAVIIVRNAPLNKNVLECCSMSRAAIGAGVLEVVDGMLGRRPGDYDLLLSRAAGLYLSGRYTEAEAALLALPVNPSTKGLLRMVRAAGNTNLNRYRP